MNTPLELQLGLARLSVELDNLQRLVEEALSTCGLTMEDGGSEKLVARAQYLLLQAAIHPPKVSAGSPSRGALKRGHRSKVLRIAYSAGQRVS